MHPARRLAAAREQDQGPGLLPELAAPPPRAADRQPLEQHQLGRSRRQLSRELRLAGGGRPEHAGDPRQSSRLPGGDDDPEGPARTCRRSTARRTGSGSRASRTRAAPGAPTNGITATMYTVNHGADSWHVLFAWGTSGSLYTLSEHVAPPMSYSKVVANLKRMLERARARSTCLMGLTRRQALAGTAGAIVGAAGIYALVDRHTTAARASACALDSASRAAPAATASRSSPTTASRCSCRRCITLS